MILRAENGSKTNVISSDDDRSSLAVYVEHSPALEPRCDGFFLCSGRIEVVKTRWHLCCLCCAAKALMFESKGPPE